MTVKKTTVTKVPSTAKVAKPAKAEGEKKKKATKKAIKSTKPKTEKKVRRIYVTSRILEFWNLLVTTYFLLLLFCGL